MNKPLFVLITIAVSLSNCTTSKSFLVSEGQMIRTTIMANNNFTPTRETNTNEGFRMDERYWFKNNMVIFEEKGLSNGEDEFQNVQSVTVFNYFFIDIENKMCYAYRNFSDTAKPVYRYRLERKYPPGWSWLTTSESNISQYETFIQLQDTTIDGIKVKRVKMSYETPAYSTNYTIYGSKSFPKTIFKYNQAIDSLMQPAVPFGNLLTTSDVKMYSLVMLKLRKNKLKANENKIMAAWTENAQISTLPIYEQMEGRKKYGFLSINQD